MNIDIIVIGGGPSGLMAAISAAECNKKVLLIEKGPKLGRKLILSGGGRCNVTNRRPVDELIQHIPGNGRFLYSVFNHFNNENIITFFEKLGVELKEEDHGRMFPVSNSARSVVDTMVKQIKKLGIKIYLNTAVKNVLYKTNEVFGVMLTGGQKIEASAVVIAVGGKSVPRTGSTGDGYGWAKEAGHTITELYPTEVPLTSKEDFITSKTLQGISLRNIALSVIGKKNKPIVTHQMDMIFTHFGISGPAALRCSMFVQHEIKKSNQKNVKMHLDLFPDQSKQKITEIVYKIVEENPKKALKNALHSLLQETLLLFLLKQADLNPDHPIQQVSPKKLATFINLLKNFEFTVNGTLGFDKAFVTGGGIYTKEIIPQKMQSKMMPGLFFCGEIIDVNGYTGGYNITCALCTGHVAGFYAAEYVQKNRNVNKK